MSYSSSNLSTTCLFHAVTWVDSSYHHQFFFHTVIYLLDFIPLIFTFITLICLLISSLMFHSTSFSSYLSHHMLYFLHHIIIIRTSIGCSLCPWLMRLLMHVAFLTRGHGADHWVFEPSFPSFLLPYHLKPTLRFMS